MDHNQVWFILHVFVTRPSGWQAALPSANTALPPAAARATLLRSAARGHSPLLPRTPTSWHLPPASLRDAGRTPREYIVQAPTLGARDCGPPRPRPVAARRVALPGRAGLAPVPRRPGPPRRAPVDGPVARR